MCLRYVLCFVIIGKNLDSKWLIIVNNEKRLKGVPVNILYHTLSRYTQLKDTCGKYVFLRITLSALVAENLLRLRTAGSANKVFQVD